MKFTTDWIINSFISVVKRDLLLALRRRTDVLTTLFFFIIVISLFPLGVGSDKNTLRHLAPGVVWIAALLASMLALERLFEHDYADGTLEQMLLAPQSLSIIVVAKIFTHWLLTGLPIVLIAPLIGLQYHLPAEAVVTMTLSLLLGTPILSLIGAIGAALTLGLRGGGILLSLLILPLYIPVLIFATSAIDTSTMSLDYSGQLAILGAMLVVAIISAPIAISSALKVSVS